MSRLAYLEEASEIIDLFGNHMRRHRDRIDRHLDILRQRLAEHQLSFDEYFFDVWQETEYQLMLIEKLAESDDERHDFIKLFFSFHYVKMNIDIIRFLRLGLAERLDNPFQLYRQVLITIRQTYLTLTRCIMNRLRADLPGGEDLPPYTIFNVGSLIDHADVDIGVVFRGGTDHQQRMDAFISTLSQRFLKTVTHVHCYLAEAIGSNHYASTTEVFFDYIRQRPDDIVFISQLLGAARLSGEMELFYDFKATIVEQFFRGGSPHRLQYLADSTASLMEMIEHPLSAKTIRPKAELYRILTLLTSSLRVAYQIHRGNIWETFDQLIRVDPENRIFYGLIKDSYSFVQIFRYFYNLIVSQKDTIAFEDDAEVIWLDPVARLLGMKDHRSLHEDYLYFGSRGREAALYLTRHIRTRFL